MGGGSEENKTYKFESWIPDNKKPYVCFNRNSEHFCIYCGKKSDTREHIPSKAFLRKPYPSDLAVLPACSSCNNSFSDDELYTEIYIDALKHLSGYSNDISIENKDRVFKNSAFLDAQNDVKLFYETGSIPNRKQIERVILKLAIGHLVYELSEGYGGVEWAGNPESIEYNFAFALNDSIIENYNEFVSLNGKILPEVGTRTYNNILVFEAKLSPCESIPNSNKQLIMPLAFMNWVDVQDGNYRYMAWMEDGKTFVIKIVLHEFCYAKIVFKNETLLD
ncbi:MAG: hypothetical protein IJK26_07510 [Clostridia bacterium]|nr:hypothetical protein [Clostridia bacterium]